MNYIRHLNAFFSFVRNDERLACSHVSLYLALFQYWNFNRFQNPFPVYRINLMQLSKIGSKNTYHKCVRHLHDAGYIIYHPPASKFQVVQISMRRLDLKEEEQVMYKQLDLFSTNNDTGSVPNLTVAGTENDTGTVSKMGHSINNKHFIKESKQLPQIIFKKNEKLGKQINDLAGVPKLVHHPVAIAEVEEFFIQNNYPVEEAKKFFNHYKSIGWKIKGITPIEDWNAAAHKWMINAGKYENEKPEQPAVQAKDVESLYKLFLAGQNIFKHITAEHFAELKFELSEEIMQHAWQERINQLTGSNQNSILQLLQAYEANKENDAILLKDKDNLISLAKRISVLKYFLQQKQNSQ